MTQEETRTYVSKTIYNEMVRKYGQDIADKICLPYNPIPNDYNRCWIDETTDMDEKKICPGKLYDGPLEELKAEIPTYNGEYQGDNRAARRRADKQARLRESRAKVRAQLKAKRNG